MNVGVIGAGAISEIYLKNMTSRFSNLKVLGVAAKHLESAQRRAEQFGIKAFTVDALLADPEIEMVVNLTPVGAHEELIRRALLAGKHVYTEKTLTLDPEKAKALMALADEKGLYLGSAPDTFLGSALQAARSALDDGLLGEVHSFAISVHRNNDLLLSRYPFLREPGAGVLLDFCVYYTTALTSLFGPAAQVGGIIGTPYKTHINHQPGPDFGKVMDTPNESQVSAILRMRNGVTGTFHIDSDSNTFGAPFFAIYGTKGILQLPDPDEFGGEVLFLPNDSDAEARPVTLRQFTPYRGNSRGVGPAEMAQAIAEHRRNRASKEMAFHSLEVLTAILSAGESGAFVQIQSDFIPPAPLPQKEPGIQAICGSGEVRVPALDAVNMSAFYRRGLGLKPVDGHPEQLAAGGCVLKLCRAGQPGRQETPVRLCFTVSDIRSAREAVIGNGITPDTEISADADGRRQFQITDPDGNKVILSE